MNVDQKFMKGLEKFTLSWNEMSKLWNELQCYGSNQLNERVVKYYPFSLSFDDMGYDFNGFISELKEEKGGRRKRPSHLRLQRSIL